MQSLPSRERGLKLSESHFKTLDACVAPLAGAWIEIGVSSKTFLLLLSLPSRERGLKSSMDDRLIRIETVAPLAGAWIEMRKGVC